MPHVKSIKVLIIDDHPLFSRGLASLIESMPGYSVAGEADNPDDALKIAEKEQPSLATLELNIADESGIELISRFKSTYPEMPVLALTVLNERYHSERALHLGAQGYIMKNQPVEKIAEAIQTVAAGKLYLSGPERERLYDATTGDIQGVKTRAAMTRQLSNRELQVFTCLGKGLGTIEIASKYNLSTKTVDTHKEHIKLKLHCNSSQELRRLAIEWANHPAGNPRP